MQKNKKALKKIISLIIAACCLVTTVFAQPKPVKIVKNANLFTYEVYDYGDVIDTSLMKIVLNYPEYQIFSEEGTGPFVPGYAREITIINFEKDSCFQLAKFSGSDNSDCYEVASAFSRSDIAYDTARVNGLPLQPNHLDPAHTDYTKTCMYVLFPGIDRLTAGENTLDVTVAAGWRSNDGRYLGKQDKPRFFGPLALSAMLVMEFADGSKRSILADDTWQCGTGPIVFSHLFDGETYDARLESVACRPVKTIDPPGGVMRPMTIPPIMEENEIMPASVSQTEGGWLLDFGKNISGMPRLRFKYPLVPGQTVTMHCCERLREDGTPYFDNLRGAAAYRAQIHRQFPLRQRAYKRHTGHGRAD